MANASTQTLLNIETSRIDRNPDNPRVLFRTEEMGLLLASIKRHGIQVPVTVYKDRHRYILIDGERRWRCATKLNLSTLPAIVTDKPTALANLLLMFNIHSLREQWDYFTIANKLPRVIELFRKERGVDPTEAELSEETGLSRGQIRRCRLLLELPQRYKNLLLQELELPKARQKLTEDFFIEMERSLKTVRNRVPEAIENVDDVRAALIDKYRAGTIPNVVEFRKVRKIATSVEYLGVERKAAAHALLTIFDPESTVSVGEIFGDKFELQYDEHKALRTTEALTAYLALLADSDKREKADPVLLKQLRKLRRAIDRVLGD